MPLLNPLSDSVFVYHNAKVFGPHVHDLSVEEYCRNVMGKNQVAHMQILNSMQWPQYFTNLFVCVHTAPIPEYVSPDHVQVISPFAI